MRYISNLIPAMIILLVSSCMGSRQITEQINKAEDAYQTGDYTIAFKSAEQIIMKTGISMPLQGNPLISWKPMINPGIISSLPGNMVIWMSRRLYSRQTTTTGLIIYRKKLPFWKNISRNIPGESTSIPSGPGCFKPVWRAKTLNWPGSYGHCWTSSQ